MTVRRLMHGMGYCFRLHRKRSSRYPDLVYPIRRSVIFVYVCFCCQLLPGRCGWSEGPCNELIVQITNRHLRSLRHRFSKGQNIVREAILYAKLFVHLL